MSTAMVCRQGRRNFFGSAWLESVTLDELDRVAHPELP